MNLTAITLYPKLIVDKVDPKIFGGFLEHMGRAVYEGIYDPTSTHSDENGYRKDVLKVLQELKMPIIRYPGGNFASGYHWKNGIGTKKNQTSCTITCLAKYRTKSIRNRRVHDPM